MKKRIYNFILRHRRWIIVFAYLFAFFIVWHNRQNFIYKHIPFLLRAEPLDFVLLVFAFIGLVCIIQLPFEIATL